MCTPAPETNIAAENQQNTVMLMDRKIADFQFFLWAILAFLGGYLLLPFAAPPDDPDMLPEFWEILLQPTICGLLLTIGAYRITGSWRQIPAFLQLDKWRWSFLWKCPLGSIGLLVVVGILTMIWETVAKRFQLDLGTPASANLAMNGSPAQIAAMATAAIVLAPLMEEILFRRALFQALKHLSNAYIAAIVSAMAFAAVHLTWLQVPGFIFIAVVWQTVVCRTQSLWSSILLHFFNNMWAVSALLLMKKYGLD